MVRQVLIIEDDATSASIYSNILSDDGGYECEIASLTSNAMSRLQNTTKTKIDVTLLDLTLPNSIGVDLIRWFNGQFPHIPLVVVTGKSIEVEEVIEAGAQSVLFKGEFIAKDLIRAVREAIPRHQVRGMYLPLEKDLNRLKEHIVKTKEKLADPNQLLLTKYSEKDSEKKE